MLTDSTALTFNLNVYYESTEARSRYLRILTIHSIHFFINCCIMLQEAEKAPKYLEQRFFERLGYFGIAFLRMPTQRQQKTQVSKSANHLFH
jgi:hypothetical protein